MLKKLVTIPILLSVCMPLVASADWIEFGGYSSTRLPAVKSAVGHTSPVIKTSRYASDSNSGELVVTTSIRLPGMYDDKVESGGMVFSAVTIPGWPSQSVEPGKPAVPSKSVYIPVPSGYKVKNVRTENEIKHTFSQMNVIPAQPPVPVLRNYKAPFVMDRDAYKKDELYPKSSIKKCSIVKLRDKNFLIIEATPVQVNAKTKTAVVSSEIDVKVTLIKDRETSLNIMPSAQTSFDPELYMILMDDQFKGNKDLQTFIDWKTKKGNKVRTVLTSDINSNGAPDSLQIRNFLRNLPSDQYPENLLIIGDETADNGVKGWGYTTRVYWDTVNYSDYKGFTDLYYACRDNTDNFPDLSYGRLPAKSNDSLSTMIKKVYQMDATPPSTPLNNRVLTSGFLETDSGKGIRERIGFLSTVDAVSAYFEQNGGDVSYLTTRATTNPDNAGPTCIFNDELWTWRSPIGTRIVNSFRSPKDAKDAIVNSLNGGVRMHFHYSHGSNNGWSNPSFSTNDVRRLINGDNRPLVISLGCLTGQYQEPNNFTTEWLLSNGGGSHAVIASTNVSWAGLCDWFGHGLMIAHFPQYRSWHDMSTNPDWDKSMPEPVLFEEGSSMKYGDFVNKGKLYSAEVKGFDEDFFRNFQLFGDPDGDIQINDPVKPVVSHPAGITSSETGITVNTGMAGNLVCLYSKEMGLHKAGYTQGSSITFPVSNLSSGTINVTVTGSGILPYDGTIQVSGGQAPVFDVTMTPDANVYGNSMQPVISIKNISSASVNLSDIAIEYYHYDPTLNVSSLVCDIYYCNFGNTIVSKGFQRLGRVLGNNTDKADAMMVLSFSGGTLAANQTFTVNCGIHSADWQYNFNESDDWSHVTGAGTTGPNIVIRSITTGAVLSGTVPQ